MLAHERRVMTSLRRVNDDVSEHSVHLTRRSLQRTNTPLRLSYLCGNQLLELCSTHSARHPWRVRVRVREGECTGLTCVH